MKARVSIAAVALAGSAALSATAHGSAPHDAAATQRGAPQVAQMVVFRDGSVVSGRVAAQPTRATVDGRRCAIAARTPMAALLRAKPGRIAFHDYGDCSLRPADSAGLFVEAIRGQRNRAQDGWVYKVGRKLATAGAADPAGPFGSGRLKGGERIVWFYCRQFSTGSCQRSLEVDADVDGRRLTVSVTGYDDSGDGVAIRGATVRAGGKSATTDGDGKATLRLSRGAHRVYAEKRGATRSFARRVTIG